MAYSAKQQARERIETLEAIRREKQRSVNVALGQTEARQLLVRLASLRLEADRVERELLAHCASGPSNLVELSTIDLEIGLLKLLLKQSGVTASEVNEARVKAMNKVAQVFRDMNNSNQVKG